MDPKVCYFATNSVFAKEFETKFPLMFPLVNLISLGITNYYDVIGSLSVMHDQKVEHDKFRKQQEERKAPIIPPEIESPYLQESNLLLLHRGTNVSEIELRQWERQKGQDIHAKSFISTSIDKMTALEFCGNYEKLSKGQARVKFEIMVDLDFTNDIGTFIMLMSMAKSEDEHLLAPGTKFEVGEIHPEIITNRGSERRLKIDQNKDVEE